MSRSMLAMVTVLLMLLVVLALVVEVNLSLGTLTSHRAWTAFLEAWCRLHCTGN